MWLRKELNNGIFFKKPEILQPISPPRNTATNFLKQSPKASECLLNESLSILHYHLSITQNATKLSNSSLYRMVITYKYCVKYSSDYDTYTVFKKLIVKGG